MKIKPYKLKHILTGLYYQPHKHRGSHLSKNGKIYQTKSNALDTGNYNKTYFRIFCQKDSTIYKLTKEVLNWENCSWSYNQLAANTEFKDWVKEEI